jgi:hypothetical protein
MSLNSISGQFRNVILNLNLQAPPDVVTGLVNLTNSVTVNAYLSSLGQDAAIHFHNVKNPGDVDTDGIPARIANLNKTLNTPADINTGLLDTTTSAAYVASLVNSKGQLTVINDFSNVNPSDVLTEAVAPRNLDLSHTLNTPTDITAGVNNLTPNAAFAAQYLSGRGSFTIVNDFVNVNPGDVLTDAVAPRNLDFAMTLNTPTDITAGVNNLTPNASYAAQYLSGKGAFTVINTFANINPGDVLTDAVVPRALDLAMNIGTPTDITAGVRDLTPNAAFAAQYLAGLGTFSVINTFNVVNPGDVLSDAITPRTQNFAQTLNTPTDITAGVNVLSPNASLAAQYLSGKGTFVAITTSPNVNPGDVLSEAVTPRIQNFAQTLNTPVDIAAGLTNLSGAFAAQYLAGRGSFVAVTTSPNVNPGDVVTDSVIPRTQNFARTLNTPVDITAGLTNLSGAFAAQYLAGRGLEGVINDYINVNPGDIVTDSFAPRTLDLAKNLNTPADITAGILNLTPSALIASQYLGGRGLDTTINNFNVVNPGDVLTDALIPRTLNFSMTLNTPTDVAAGLTALSPSASIAAQYLAGRGTLSQISTFANLNPGDVVTLAGPIMISLFNKNMVKDPTDPTDAFTLANPGIVPVGTPTIINDFIVPNQTQLSGLTPNYTTNISSNKYAAENIVVYEILQNLLLNQTPNTPQNPYLTQDKLNNADPTDIRLSDFLNVPTASTPLSALLGADLDIANLLTEPTLKNDTVLAQIAALQLRFNLNTRLLAKAAQEVAGLTTIDDMLTNPLKVIEFIKDPSSILERGNADITTFKGGLGKLASFISDIGGLGGLTSAFFEDDSVTLRPTCFGDSQIEDRLENRVIDRLDQTGRSQRFFLFSNLGNNKYSPDYEAKLSAADKRIFKRTTKAQKGVEDVVFKPYITAGKNVSIFNLLQDNNGLQVKSNSELTRSIRIGDSGIPNFYVEPGVEDVSKYGSVETSFIWRGETKETRWTIEDGKNGVLNWDADLDADILSKTISSAGRFRDCSIMDITQRLLNSSESNRAIRSIDQTKTKFTDGYHFSPKGSGVIGPIKTERKNKKDEVIGYSYLVPGLDTSGKRDDERMYNEVTLCRAWTKAKPFSKITDLIRWKELNRKERNSVLDRYGNLNIHPSALNVNEGYGRLGDGLGDAVVEAFGEKRARKYMFSIENLAWRDSAQFNDLPPCEKGSNGGRIMWFPPYNIRFTDDTTTNWTTHQFLGRPEPIYTYNNTERSGTLSWDIVVDHPTIMNLLVDKEFARLTNGEVDELLAAFWAGCLDYDVFELARIWGVFTDSDIEYFRNVISDLDVRLPNEKIRNKVESSGSFQQEGIKLETPRLETLPQTEFNLFFENDIPIPKNSYKNPKEFTVDSYNKYFEVYSDLANAKNLNQNSEYKEALVSGKSLPISAVNGWIRYDFTIGKNAPKENKHFFESDRKRYPQKSYGYEEQYNKIALAYSAKNYASTKDYNLRFSMVAYASPSAPGQDLESLQRYNDKLASRRFVSVTKWLILTVMQDADIKCYTLDNDEIDSEEKVNQLHGDLETSKRIVILRGDNNSRQEISFDIVSRGQTLDDLFQTIPADPANPNAPKTPIDNEYKTLFGRPLKAKNSDVEYFPISYGENKTYYMFRTKDEWYKHKDNFIPVDKNEAVKEELIGTCVAAKTNPFKQDVRTEADIVCGSLSPIVSFSRRVEINASLVPKEMSLERKEPPAETPPLYIEEEVTTTNVTKREIAQRILNKLLTECDYFDYLSEESPIIFDSLKEKLKYFSPAFHAMTPEGLNARLTFLQQCMRPGDTITKDVGISGCDAKNTAFGRPPVSVLRIGDFYHTKIIINSLNISYDPLLWDLNPEGIGVQPMLAKVNLSFKYIGGQGLRRYVDQLQNALTFNYYANTDVYDERTFANTDRRERDLINLEQDFFAENTLDLIPIVAAAELITPSTEGLPIPYGTIGVISERLLPKLAGGTYYNDLTSATTFNPTTEYAPETCVTYQGQYYVRTAAQYPINNNGSYQLLNPTDPLPTNAKKVWTAIDHSNFGEFAFRQEYGRYYIQRYDIQYYNLFSVLYTGFGEYMKGFASLIGKPELLNDPSIAKYKVIDNVLKNKNYKKPLSVSGTTISEIINNISNTTTPNMNLNGLTYSEIFNRVAEEKKYIEVGDVFKQHPFFLSKNNNKEEEFEALKLNLHPQEYMFKIGDGKGLPYNYTALTGATNNGRSSKYFQGNFTNGYTNNFKNGISETGGIYFRDTNGIKIYKDIISTFSDEFRTKIATNTLAFWFNEDDDLKTFKNFYKNLDTQHIKDFTSYIDGEFTKFMSIKDSDDESTINLINDSVAKMSVALAGLSLPLYGYDATYSEGRAKLYEVIPNGKKLTTPVTGSTMFGYNPYEKYKKLSINGGDLINLEGVYNILNDANTPSPPTGFTINQYASLGNGLYFFKQMKNNIDNTSSDAIIKEYTRNMEYIKKVFGYTTLSELPNQYDFDNFLPTNNALYFSGTTEANTFKFGQTATPISGPVTNENFSFNPYEYGTSDSARSLETTSYALVTRANDGSVLNTANNIYSQGVYQMKYTFEKINYELLDFSNKTLEFMLSDESESKNNDIDLSYTPAYRFDLQINNLSGVTLNSTGTTIGDTVSDILFYYGVNKKTNSQNSFIKDINYYLFNENNPNITGATLNTQLKNLNLLMAYDYTITKEYVDSLPDQQKLKLSGFNGPTTGATSGATSGITYGEVVKMSAMHEVLFIEFLHKLYTNKSIAIGEIISKIENTGINPPASVKDNKKRREAYVEAQRKKIKKSIEDTFKLIEVFVKKYDGDLGDVLSYMNNLDDNTIKNINKNVFGIDNKTTIPTAVEIRDKFIKGSPEDYTVTFRETSKLDPVIIRNLKLFTKYKNESIINIPSTNEPESIKENDETQLSILYPEIYN